MNGIQLSSVFSIAAVVAIVLWIGVRQLAWTPLSPRSLWITPGVLGLVGLVNLGGVPASALTPPALALLIGEVVLGAVVGAAIGAITQVRPAERGTVDRRGQEIRWQTRTLWVGVALWFGLIGARVGLDLWASAAGFGALEAATGAILLVVAVNRLARSLVLEQRISRGAVRAA